MKLTEKQKMFCKEYIVDLNGTQAAIRAGYSEKTAKQIANENLTKPYMQEYIKESLDKRSQKVEVDADYVLRGIKSIAEGVETKDNDRLKAYELIGKHLKLFTDKVEHSGEQSLKINFNIPRPTDGH